MGETPPRTWGRRRKGLAHNVFVRNTPTHVGKTSRSRRRPSCLWKHPHARGEDWRSGGGAPARKETPPRTWGRLFASYLLFCRPRNTPTHVGKTTLNNGANNNLEKHPHARGEDRHRECQAGTGLETPPRTWGRQLTEDTHLALSGNTPTHVGKTALLSVLWVPRGKHPHARGEDELLKLCALGAAETPPRTWGRRY